METKKRIRQECLMQRNAMTQEEVCLLSEEICHRMMDIPVKPASVTKWGCYGYYPCRQEASLMPIYQLLLEENIPLAFPKVKGSEMEFYQVHSMDSFSTGTFQVNEPDNDCPLVCWKEAVVFVPGVAFDRKGNRFGYGKGYYDRYFAMHRGLKRLGIAYESQIKEQISTEEYDIPMHGILSETGCIWIEK